MEHLHTISAYVDDIVDQIDESSQRLLKGKSKAELSTLHHSWGMAIRNECGLWHPTHPLTQHWHEKPEERVIIDGVDHSPDHPDAVSMRIMEGVWQKVTA